MRLRLLVSIAATILSRESNAQTFDFSRAASRRMAGAPTPNTSRAFVVEALGGSPTDKIAGFLFLGTPSRALEERPRPAHEAVVSTWQG